MQSTDDQNHQKPRGTFRFLSVPDGADFHRSLEVNTAGHIHVAVLHSNSTEEEERAKLVADGYIEIDRDGLPIDMQHSILQRDAARMVLQEAVDKLAALGIAGMIQPIVSPIDASAGLFLIVAKDGNDVASLRALLTAGCDACSGNNLPYARALEMIKLMDA